MGDIEKSRHCQPIAVAYHMHKFLFSQEPLWCSKSGRLELDPHRVTRPAGFASPSPDHVPQPGSLLILRRKLAVSRDVLSHAFQSQSDNVFHHFRRSWRCQLCRASLRRPEEGGCSPKVLVFATGRCWRKRVLVLCSGFGGGPLLLACPWAWLFTADPFWAAGQ